MIHKKINWFCKWNVKKMFSASTWLLISIYYSIYIYTYLLKQKTELILWNKYDILSSQKKPEILFKRKRRRNLPSSIAGSTQFWNISGTFRGQILMMKCFERNFFFSYFMLQFPFSHLATFDFESEVGFYHGIRARCLQFTRVWSSNLLLILTFFSLLVLLFWRK